MLSKYDIPMPMGEAGSDACTSDQVCADNLELDAATLDEFSLEASDFNDMGLTALQNEDILILNAYDLRVLFEDSSDNGLDTITEDEGLERRPSKKRKASSSRPSKNGVVVAGCSRRNGQGEVRSVQNKREEGRSSAANSGNDAPVQSVTPKPAIGYPAGQLPLLPSNVPGIVWGLPTNPLQIMPKPTTSMNGTAGTSYTPSTPIQTFGGMMPFSVPSIGNDASKAQGTSHQSFMRMPPVPPIYPGPPAGPSAQRNDTKQAGRCTNPASSTPANAGTSGKASSTAMRMPFPPMMMPFPMPPVMPPMPTMMPPFMDVGSMGTGGMMMPPLNPLKPDALKDIMAGCHGKLKETVKPPLGLQLKKSDSFADLIASCLQHSVEAS